MAYVTRDQIATTSVRRRQDVESPVFGGTLLIQELSRLDWRTAIQIAKIPNDPKEQVYIDWWDGAVFAAGVIDPLKGEALFTMDDILLWANRGDLWDEIRRVAALIRELSEVGPESLKSGDPAPDAG